MNQQYEAPSEANPGWPTPLSFATPTRFGNISSDLKAYVDLSAASGSNGTRAHLINTRCRLPTDHRRVWFIVHVWTLHDLDRKL